MTRRAALDLRPAMAARGTVVLPGSKSISIRALLLAALADGPTSIEGLLRSDDTRVMLDALRALGVPIDERGAGTVVVRGAPAFPHREARLFVGNSGLSIRTLAAALAFAGGRYRLSGVERMHERPIGDLVDALRAAGARIEYGGRSGYPPLRIEPAVPARAEAGQRLVRVDGRTSSQFLTGVLQAAPMLSQDADLVVEVEGGLISRPYVDLTIALLATFGVDVERPSDRRFVVRRDARLVAPGAYVVEGDASSASYFLAAGLVGGGPLTVDGAGRGSLQGDARFADVVVAMGGDVEVADTSTTVRSSRTHAGGHRLRAIDAGFDDIPDAAMTVAVLALFADGPCTLRGIGSWRVKETDRIAAMATELAKVGAEVQCGDDWLRVTPLSAAAVAALVERGVRGDPVSVATYDDHRIAMCFSLVRFLGVAVRIEDPDCVAKTFPDYFERLEALVEPPPALARRA